MNDFTELDKAIARSNNFQHVTYQEKILRSFEELLDTDHTKILKRGWKEWDELLGGIYWGKLYVFGADTGVGKSTFINSVCNNVSNQWARVVKYSLEDRMEDIGKEELFYTANRCRYRDKKTPYEWTKFVNNEYTEDSEFRKYLEEASLLLIKKTNLIELDKKRQVTIDDLISLMEEECDKGTKLFAIDHLHYFDMGDSHGRHDLKIQSIMQEINELARKRNVAVFIVAHYAKNKLYWATGQPSYDDFKDGSAIKQVANIIIQITRILWDNAADDKSQFWITKMRWPIRPPEYLESWFNLKTFEYDFKKTKQQLSHEKWFA